MKVGSIGFETQSKTMPQEQRDSFTSKMRNKKHEPTKLPCQNPDSLSLPSLSRALASVSPTFPSPFSTQNKIKP